MSKGKRFLKVVAAGTSLVVSGAALAVDQTTVIAAAGTEASTNTAAVIAAVLALAILSFGVKSLLGWFKN